MVSELKFAELLCTRLCHDLTGPIGAIANGAEFLSDEGFDMQGQAIELISSSAAQAVSRLQFYRKNASCRPPSTVMTWPVVLLRRLVSRRKIASAWSPGVIGDLVRVRLA